MNGAVAGSWTDLCNLLVLHFDKMNGAARHLAHILLGEFDATFLLGFCQLVWSASLWIVLGFVLTHRFLLLGLTQTLNSVARILARHNESRIAFWLAEVKKLMCLLHRVAVPQGTPSHMQGPVGFRRVQELSPVSGFRPIEDLSTHVT